MCFTCVFSLAITHLTASCFRHCFLHWQRRNRNAPRTNLKNLVRSVVNLGIRCSWFLIVVLQQKGYSRYSWVPIPNVLVLGFRCTQVLTVVRDNTTDLFHSDWHPIPTPVLIKTASRTGATVCHWEDTDLSSFVVFFGRFKKVNHQITVWHNQYMDCHDHHSNTCLMVSWLIHMYQDCPQRHSPDFICPQRQAHWWSTHQRRPRRLPSSLTLSGQTWVPSTRNGARIS